MSLRDGAGDRQAESGASLLHGMAKASANTPLDIAGTALMFAAGVEAVAQRGKTGVGSKTMMDVLIPVAARFKELAAVESPALRKAVLDELPQVAEQNMLATRDMLATKGRAGNRRHRPHGLPGGQEQHDAIAGGLCEAGRGTVEATG